MLEASFVNVDRPACDLSDLLDIVIFSTHILSFTYDELERGETFANSSEEMYNVSYVCLFE